MRYLNKIEAGVAPILVLGIIGFLAISLPLATKLVQQTQENRSEAAGIGCGSAGRTSKCSNSAPTSSLCASGYSSSNMKLDGTNFKWKCSGNGKIYNCSKRKCTDSDGAKQVTPVKVVSCSSSNKSTVTAKPTFGLCNNSTAIWDDEKAYDGEYNWHCGSDSVKCGAKLVSCSDKGGTCRHVSACPTEEERITSVYCGSPQEEKMCCVPKKATCGGASLESAFSKPSGYLCNPSSAKAVWVDETGSSGYFKWTCEGLGGDKISCQTKKLAYCGTADGKNFEKKPTTNLCKEGTVTWVDETASSGYWVWNCRVGGYSQRCSAPKVISVVYDKNAGKCVDYNGKVWSKNAAVCLDGVEYICKVTDSTKQGSLVGVKKCTLGCASNGKCAEVACTGAGGTCRTKCNTGETFYSPGSTQCSPATCCK